MTIRNCWEDRHVECSGSFCDGRRAFWPIVRRDLLILVCREVQTWPRAENLALVLAWQHCRVTCGTQCRRSRSRQARIGNPTQGCKPRRRIADRRGRPLQWRVEVDALLVAERQPERGVTVDIEHDVCRRAAGLKAGIEHPGGAEPIEPGAVGDGRRLL